MKTSERIYKDSPWNLKMEAIRVLQGLERKELAKRIGVSIWNYSSWARGDHYPIRNYRERICAVLEISIEEIFESLKPQKGDESNATREATR